MKTIFQKNQTKTAAAGRNIKDRAGILHPTTASAQYSVSGPVRYLREDAGRCHVIHAHMAGHVMRNKTGIEIRAATE